MPAFIRLHDWPILARLAFGFGLTLLLLCAMALLGLVGLHQTQTLQTTLGQTLATQHRGEQVRALLTLDLVKSQAIIRSVGMPEVADRFKPELLAADKDTAQQLDALKQVDQPDIAKAAQELQRQHRDYLNTRNQVLALVESGQTIQATEKENAVLTPAATAMSKQQAELTRRVNAETERAQSQVERLTKTISALIASLAFCAFAIGLLCAWKIAQSVNLPVQMAVSASQAIAEGKLYLDVPTPQRQDELGHLLQSMKHMRDHLVQVTSQVRDRSEGVATSSAEVATGAQRLSASTHSHTSALNQSRSALERIETEIGHNLDQARQACALAGTAREAAQTGAQAMMQVIDQMRGIHESSQRVTDIISVIDGIAFQTNILALNAAVEAARAGEEGRGFAVVAAEVRTLAQRSANAAREIKQLITASTERVTAGATIVDQTGATIVSLQNTIDEVVALIHSLNDASTRHAAGISDVRQTVVDLDAASIDNMSLMTQSAAAAADLQNQAAHLLQAVSAFELTRH